MNAAFTNLKRQTPGDVAGVTCDSLNLAVHTVSKAACVEGMFVTAVWVSYVTTEAKKWLLVRGIVQIVLVALLSVTTMAPFHPQVPGV